MIQRQLSIEHAAPWLVSGVSGLYIMARARRLSQADASDTSLTHFLIHQSDLVLMLCGCPAIWHFVQNRCKRMRRQALHDSQARAIHQLRQVLTALMLGTGLLARKAIAGKTANLSALATRLNNIAREGAVVLDELGDSHPPDLLDRNNKPVVRHAIGVRLGA